MKIGIFGGSFNPIHTGHAILTNYLINETDLDAVWLMVAPRNPIKTEYDRTYDLHRLRMTEMVAIRFDGVITSGLEFSLPQPSYTINTLRTLSEKFPDDKFVLVIGADNWSIFTLNSPVIEISSTMVREKLSRGENLSYYLPDDVYRYIIKHNLYTAKQ